MKREQIQDHKNHSWCIYSHQQQQQRERHSGKFVENVPDNVFYNDTTHTLTHHYGW